MADSSFFGSLRKLGRSKSSASKKSGLASTSNRSMGAAPPTTNMASNKFGEPLNPPPPYTEMGSTGQMPTIITTPPQPPQPQPSGDDSDKYSFLATFDTILLVDDSGSMSGGRWREVASALESIVPIVTRYDSDGIDLYFLHQKSTDAGSEREGVSATGYRNISSPPQVKSIFDRVKPTSNTPTGTRLSAILKPYILRCEKEIPKGRDVKPINLIVITDGNPTDDVEGVIVHFAKRLDAILAPPSQVGIQFFQVGQDPACAEALRDLDDGLSEVRDMVDTVTWDKMDRGAVALSADTILKTVLGAVMKRLDRKKVEAVQRR